MSNEEMKPRRYYRWALARKKVRDIRQHLEAGGTVVISTWAKHTKADKRHVDMFRSSRSGAYMQRGKNWDNIDYCAIRFY